MKTAILSFSILFGTLAAAAQEYPNPDFNNEVCAYRKDSNRVSRLEKQTSEISNKVGFGGFTPSTTEYDIDGGRSTIRLSDIGKYSFVFWNGSTGGATVAGNRGDSMMRASGVDPNMITQAAGMNGPSQFTLYKMEVSGGKRSIILVKAGGFSFGKKSSSGSEKYSTSMRKIREGYFEMVVDKRLPKGEYAFVTLSGGVQGMHGGANLFCFGVD
ncbi:MAG: hypothetical protein Q8927_09420 [Bacteroidota bacterium]|nr:hypothetical protein [Bacteroidota bacterium]MDP4216409.1 hypothetical protein [Bacteroidota bacterium]MDP4244965.1 hypothetical protein [Bacteroidota bacterium]MDP4252521.1 hypothetical protein [Bacteroidota bacterium]MDP4260240.1 hypothetical protein [Bacteroidota bacterium]